MDHVFVMLLKYVDVPASPYIKESTKRKTIGKRKMTNLIAKYENEPTEKNLIAIKKHLNKHPMAALMLTKEQAKIFG